MEENISLCGAQIGGTYRVVGIDLPRATHIRLVALGLTAGTRVTVLNNKRSGSVVFNVRGTRLAVGRGIAENIRVSPEQAAGAGRAEGAGEISQSPGNR